MIDGCIYLCEIEMFVLFGGYLCYKELELKDRVRLIVYCDGDIVDLNSGDLIEQLPESGGLVDGPIHENVRYHANKFYVPDSELPSEVLERAKVVYDEHREKKDLIEQNKLVPFQQKRLY